MKVTWAPDVQQGGLISPGNIAHSDMSLTNSIWRLQDWRTVLITDETDSTLVLVTDVFESGNDRENDTGSATLRK